MMIAPVNGEAGADWFWETYDLEKGPSKVRVTREPI